MKSAWFFLPLVFSLAARADTLTVPDAYSGQTHPSGSYVNLILNGTPDNHALGGSVPGSTGVIGGHNVSFSQVFCIQLDTDITVGATYTARTTRTARSTTVYPFRTPVRSHGSWRTLVPALSPKTRTSHYRQPSGRLSMEAASFTTELFMLTVPWIQL